jgi:uncharacterized protein YjbI with pentapeptide repeats
MSRNDLDARVAAHAVWFAGGAISVEADDNSVRGCDFSAQDHSNASFEGLDLSGCGFRRAMLRYASFVGARLDETDFRDADLTGADFRSAIGLTSDAIAGADLTGARFDESLAKLWSTDTITDLGAKTYPLFVAILGGCLYTLLTIGATRDASLITGGGTLSLPLLQVSVSTVGFYFLAPLLLAALHIFLITKLLRLFELFANLPAVFPNGQASASVTTVWPGDGFIRGTSPHRARGFLTVVEYLVSVVAIWCVVPATVTAVWAMYLRLHHLRGSAMHVALMLLTLVVSVVSFRHARRRLKGVRSTSTLVELLWQPRMYAGAAVTAALFLLGIAFNTLAIEAGPPGSVEKTTLSPLYKITTTIVDLLTVRTAVDISNAQLSVRPAEWKDLEIDATVIPDDALLRQIRSNIVDIHAPDLGARDLRFANFYQTFIVNGNFEQARLDRAFFRYADARGAKFGGAQAELADFSGAKIHLAELTGTFSRADFSDADLRGADLSGGHFEEASFHGANLRGANLSDADFRGADLREAHLDGANLERVNFFAADLRKASLTSVRNAEHVSCLALANLHETTGGDLFFHASGPFAEEGSAIGPVEAPTNRAWKKRFEDVWSSMGPVIVCGQLQRGIPLQIGWWGDGYRVRPRSFRVGAESEEDDALQW